MGTTETSTEGLSTSTTLSVSTISVLNENATLSQNVTNTISDFTTERFTPSSMTHLIDSTETTATKTESNLDTTIKIDDANSTTLVTPNVSTDLTTKTDAFLVANATITPTANNSPTSGVTVTGQTSTLPDSNQTISAATAGPSETDTVTSESARVNSTDGSTGNPTTGSSADTTSSTAFHTSLSAQDTSGLGTTVNASETTTTTTTTATTSSTVTTKLERTSDAIRPTTPQVVTSRASFVTSDLTPTSHPIGSNRTADNITSPETLPGYVIPVAVVVPSIVIVVIIIALIIYCRYRSRQKGYERRRQIAIEADGGTDFTSSNALSSALPRPSEDEIGLKPVKTYFKPDEGIENEGLDDSELAHIVTMREKDSNILLSMNDDRMSTGFVPREIHTTKSTFIPKVKKIAEIPQDQVTPASDEGKTEIVQEKTIENGIGEEKPIENSIKEENPIVNGTVEYGADPHIEQSESEALLEIKTNEAEERNSNPVDVNGINAEIIDEAVNGISI